MILLSYYHLENHAVAGVVLGGLLSKVVRVICIPETFIIAPRSLDAFANANCFTANRKCGDRA